MKSEERTNAGRTIRDTIGKFLSGDAVEVGSITMDLRAGNPQGKSLELVVTTPNLEVVLEKAQHGGAVRVRIGRADRTGQPLVVSAPSAGVGQLGSN